MTNNLREYALLDESEYDNFISYNISGTRRQELEKKGFIITKQNRQNLKAIYKDKNSHLYNGTSLHIVVPTLRCNQNCLYCHAKSRPADSSGHDMDEQTAKKVVDFILKSPNDTIQVEFQGGEPLLAFDTIKFMVKELKTSSKDIEFSIVTNLTLMDDEMLDYVMKERIRLCTSLDGPKNVHDKIRPLKQGSSYDLVKYWIKKISSKPYPIDALMVTSRLSLGNEKAIIDEYKDLGLRKIQLKPLSYLEMAKANWKKIGYSPEEFLKFYKNSLDYIISLNNDEMFIELITYYILVKILTDKRSIFLDLQSPCGAAIGQLAYDYDGKIYTCDEGRNFEIFNLGHVSTTDYKDLMTSQKVCSMVSFSINDNFICDDCVYKPFCGLCPVCNYSTYGDPVTSVPETDRCKIFMGIFDTIFEKMQDKKSMAVFRRWIDG